MERGIVISIKADEVIEFKIQEVVYNINIKHIVGSDMNNEDKLYDLLEKTYIELYDLKKQTNSRFGKVDSRFDNIDTRFDNLEDKLNGIKSNNADRHVSIGSKIKNIKTELSKIEIITTDNWGHIARLKAKRKHKI